MKYSNTGDNKLCKLKIVFRQEYLKAPIEEICEDFYKAIDLFDNIEVGDFAKIEKTSILDLDETKRHL